MKYKHICQTCKYCTVHISNDPCKSCLGTGPLIEYKNWAITNNKIKWVGIVCHNCDMGVYVDTAWDFYCPHCNTKLSLRNAVKLNEDNNIFTTLEK